MGEARRREGQLERSRLTRQTTAEAVAERLRAEIQRGDLEPGQRLRQSTIAARFGVSTTPVREALALLQADGLVRIDPHRGAVVFRPSIQDVREFYEIREALETLAVTLAIPNLSEADLSELQELVDTMRRTTDPSKWVEMNNLFHLGLYRASRRLRLVNMIVNLRDASSAYIHMFVANHSPHPYSDDEHQAILDACKARDVDAARRAVSLHLTHTLSGVTDFIEHQTVARNSEKGGVL